MKRLTTLELLDEDLGTPEEIGQSFDDLWWLNRHFGGISGLHRLLVQLPRRPRIRLLDVGAGRGEMAAAAAAWLRTQGCEATVFALDRRTSHLGAGVASVAAEAQALPFADSSIDVVMCNLLLHHFSEGGAVALLREMYRVAGTALLVNDLERAWLPYLYTRTILPLWASRLTRFDAPASVRQAYTAAELGELAAEAKLGRHQVLHLPAWRLGLIAWKGSDAAL